MDTRPPGVELALGALPAQFFLLQMQELKHFN